MYLHGSLGFFGVSNGLVVVGLVVAAEGCRFCLLAFGPRNRAAKLRAV